MAHLSRRYQSPAGDFRILGEGPHTSRLYTGSVAERSPSFVNRKGMNVIETPMANQRSHLRLMRMLELMIDIESNRNRQKGLVAWLWSEAQPTGEGGRGDTRADHIDRVPEPRAPCIVLPAVASSATAKKAGKSSDSRIRAEDGQAVASITSASSGKWCASRPANASASVERSSPEMRAS